MPKLIYFPVQGRAQMIRFLLDAKGIQFEDQHVTGPQWQEIKAAGTYGNCQTPIYVRDDGTFMTQSNAIMKSLAMEHGYAPQNPQVMYEAEWFHGMIVDVIEQPARFGMLRDEPT